MPEILLILAALIALLIAVLCFRSAQVRPIRSEEPLGVLIDVDTQHAVSRLGEAVRIPTISHQDPEEIDHAAFLQFQSFLSSTFPGVHEQLTREIVTDYSLLYTWAGKNSSIKPLLLLAHLDVVPVEAGTEGDWAYPPFGGCIEEGYLWGRGAMDDKGSLMGILEAVEALLKTGFQPERTVYLAFGQDEEVGGLGALSIASILAARGLEFELILDEGLAVTDGIVNNVTRPVAMIGVSEKGYASIELSIDLPGGHSSMPPKETAIGILSRAIASLEKNPMPARLDKTFRDLFAQILPEMPAFMKMVFSNLWLFERLVLRMLSSSTTMNASIRTTTAPTIFQAGMKDNVLPSKARAVVNFRLLPGDTVESVIEHVKSRVADPRIKITPLEGICSNPSPVSDTTLPAYSSLAQAIRKSFPGVLVAPSLVLGATDCRRYAGLSKSAFRFSPLWIKSEDLRRIHGSNERISIDNYRQMIQFYAEIIRSI